MCGIGLSGVHFAASGFRSKDFERRAPNAKTSQDVSGYVGMSDFVKCGMRDDDVGDDSEWDRSGAAAGGGGWVVRVQGALVWPKTWGLRSCSK